MRLATKKCLHLYHFSPLRFPINDQSIKRIPGPKHGLETSHLTWFSFHTNCGPPRNNTLCSWVFVASTSAKRPKKGHKSMRTLEPGLCLCHPDQADFHVPHLYVWDLHWQREHLGLLQIAVHSLWVRRPERQASWIWSMWLRGLLLRKAATRCVCSNPG